MLSTSHITVLMRGDDNNISNNVIYNIKGNGIPMYGNNVVIHDNTIRDVETGITICGENSVVTSNYIKRANTQLTFMIYCR